MTTLIPRELLFGNPTRANATIDPTGRHLAWLAPVDGVLNVWIAPRDQLDRARPLTRATGRPIRAYTWATRGDHVIYVQDLHGDENHHAYAVEIATGAVRDLTPFPGVQARILGRPRRDPDAIVVGLNDRVPQLHDVWRIDVRTGERTLLVENDLGAIHFSIDDDGRVRAATCPTPEGGSLLLARRDGGWQPLVEVGKDDGLYTGAVAVRADDVLWIDAVGRDTAALYAVDLGTGARTLLAASDRSDLADVLLDPVDHRLLAWSENPDVARWHAVDDAVGRALDHLGRVAAGAAAAGGHPRPEIRVPSATDDGRVWIVHASSDRRPGTYYLYDRDRDEVRELFTTRPELDDAPLAPMEVLHLTARDGLPLVAYLTRPLEARGPGPLVLLVHGGPWARDTFGYDPYHQLLANRGYAVLAVNFRGSMGFGKAFVNAADREWGGKMHDDLLDAVRHVVDLGVADPARVAIMGGSYGGYAVLWGLTATPEVFACGVDIVGPSNLETLITSVPEYWKPLIDTFHRRVGDPTTEQGRAHLRDRSPLWRADQIRRPLLIAQGANDPRVKQAESDQIVDALRARAVPVTYVLFPDEGHGFARPENNLAFMAVTEHFLARWLGGGSEPMGEVLDRSTLQWEHGREHLA